MKHEASSQPSSDAGDEGDVNRSTAERAYVVFTVPPASPLLHLLMQLKVGCCLMDLLIKHADIPVAMINKTGRKDAGLEELEGGAKEGA